MSGVAGDSDETELSVKVLDDLINRSYKQLLNTYVENAKIGELLKMIELRNKLAPTKSDQHEFWEHIDKIRREHLSVPKRNSQRSKSKSNSTTRKKAVQND